MTGPASSFKCKLAPGYTIPIAVGVAGSCLTGLLSRAVGWLRGPVDVGGIMVLAVGAILALMLHRLVARRAT